MNPQAVLERALAAQREGRPQAAAEDFQRLLKRDPRNVGLLHSLALALAQCGRGEEAITHMRKALRAAPADASLHANLGNLLRETGRRDEAIGHYREALKHQPGHANARFNLGVTLAEAGEHEEAAACLRALLPLAPDDDGLQSALLDSLLPLGQFDEAMRLLDAWLARSPDNAAALLRLGNLHHARGEETAAEAAWRRAVATAPTLVEGWNNLAALALAEDRPAEAETAAREALRHAPDYAKAWVNLAAALLALERPGEAVQAATEAARLQADAARPHYLLAMALIGVDRLRPSVAACRRCLAIEPTHVEARYHLAASLLTLGDTEEGLAELGRVLEAQPGHAGAWNTRAAAMIDAGRFDEARECIERALAIDPALADPWLLLGRLGAIRADDTRAMERLHELAESDALADDARANAHFALAQVLDKADRPGEAFVHYRAANDLLHRLLPFDDAAHVAWVDEVVATFDAAFFATRGDFGDASELPVFILGMPRSGTSLVEQILASHPAVFGGGEQTLIPEASTRLATAAGMPYPRCIARLDAAGARTVAAEVLARLRALDTQAARISDKLPANFLYVGLIALLFPRARIIHCVRDPMDVCLSNYTQRFGVGNRYSYDLNSLAGYYRQYRRLMRHWHAVLPGRILDVRYETLVAEQERVSRHLVESIGLEWDARCLDFHRTERVVHTASHVQVRQPMYASSVARWRRYERELEPLRRALGADAEAAPLAGEG